MIRQISFSLKNVLLQSFPLPLFSPSQSSQRKASHRSRLGKPGSSPDELILMMLLVLEIVREGSPEDSIKGCLEDSLEGSMEVSLKGFMEISLKGSIDSIVWKTL